MKRHCSLLLAVATFCGCSADDSQLDVCRQRLSEQVAKIEQQNKTIAEQRSALEELQTLADESERMKQIQDALLDSIEWVVDEAVDQSDVDRAHSIKTAQQWNSSPIEDRITIAVNSTVSLKGELMNQNRQEFCALVLAYAHGVEKVLSDEDSLSVAEAFATITMLMDQQHRKDKR